MDAAPSSAFRVPIHTGRFRTPADGTGEPGRWRVAGGVSGCPEGRTGRLRHRIMVRYIGCLEVAHGCH